MALVALSACASSDGLSTGSAVSQPEFTREQISDALDGGLFDTVATDQVVAECMAESGFTWIVARADPSAQIADADFVATYGYGIFSFPDDTGGDDANFVIFDALSPAEQGAYNLALVGNEQGVAPTSPDSCFGRQRQALQRLSDLASSELMRKILDEYQSLLSSAPEVEVANAGWQLCMSAAGLAYDSRDDILAELTALADTQPDGDALIAGKQRELLLAQQDYTCSSPVRAASANAAERIKAELVDRYAPG